MTIISDSVSAKILSMRQRGMHPKDIADKVGLGFITVYQHLRREGGFTSDQRAELLAAANDNSPGRVTRMSPHNGGCSTLSGMVPVTLVRVPSVDGAAVERVAA